MRSEYLNVGKIVGTHGIKGELKVMHYTDGPEFFNFARKLVCDGRELYLESFRLHKGALLCKFEGIDSLNDAEAFKGKMLYVHRKDAPPLPEGRHYIVDLIGLEVITDRNVRLGKIEDVFSTGANDVYLVKGENNKEILIPAIDDVILKTDIENGTVLISPLKGLIENED